MSDMTEMSVQIDFLTRWAKGLGGYKEGDVREIKQLSLICNQGLLCDESGLFWLVKD
jgi:hypothetical protein